MATDAGDQLTIILDGIDARGLKRVPRDDLRQLPGLYRQLATDLATGRAAGRSKPYLRGLEDLVVRAHGVLYVPERVRLGQSLGDIMLLFPQAVRHAWRYVAVATLLLVLGGVWGYGEVRRDSTSAAVLLSGGWERNAEGFRDDAKHRSEPLRSAFYFTNNAAVAFKAFALGGTFGVGTALLMLFNGVILGATMAVVGTTGSLRAFLGFILPHAGIELSAILAAAAGGLRLGDALLRPAWRTRRAALWVAAQEALPLAVGAAGLLIAAGVVEASVSPLDLPLWMKAWVGGTLDGVLVLYLASGRSAPRAAAKACTAR